MVIDDNSGRILLKHNKTKDEKLSVEGWSLLMFFQPGFNPTIYNITTSYICVYM
jgi:hypothetical protein